ncbi:MAG: hypothetical protein AB7P94_17415 [Steroidobacteraceae bacterium]
MKQSIPNYYSKNPKIFFDPTTPSSEDKAEVMELAVNQKWAELKMKRVIREGIKATKLGGVCAFKTYFYFKKDGSKDDWSGRIKNDDVRTDYITVDKLLKDASATSYETSWWVGHEVDALVDDIVERFNISKEKADQITVTRTDSENDDPLDQENRINYGRYIEIEDRRNKEKLVIVEGLETFAVKPTKLDLPFDSMYDFLSYNSIPSKSDPRSDYFFWQGQLKEICIYRTMQIRHALKGSSKYKTRGEQLDEDQLAQLKSSADSTVVNLKANQDIEPFNHATVDPAVFQGEQVARADIQLISKQAPRQGGGDKTATEVKAVEMASREITSENLELLEEIIVSIAKKWAVLMHKHYTSSRVIKLTEMSSAEFMGFKDKFGDKVNGNSNRPFLTITNKDMTDEVTARINSGSTAPDSDQARRSNLIGFTQVVAGIPEFKQRIDPDEFLDELVKVFSLENENITIRKHDPIEESRLLNSGMFVAPKLTEDHVAHLIVHERDGNGNEANEAHKQAHRLFERQMRVSREAQQVSGQIQQQQSPVTGQSFVGAPNAGATTGLPTGSPINGGKPQGVVQ